MKILVLSDVHLEAPPGTSLTLPAGLEYDAVILAGDIHSPGHRAIHWAQRASTFAGRPVFFVPGNHEFYNCEMKAELERMRAIAEGSNVHVLAPGRVVVDGVRFLGCTLWTDFQLPIRQSDGALVTSFRRAVAEARQRLYDYKFIEVIRKTRAFQRERERRVLLDTRDTLDAHLEDREWLRTELTDPFDGPTVVVTHHAPAMGSVAERYAADWLTPAFVSNLPDDFFDVPTLWVHGHTHSPFDYRRGACRVLSNPRGYRAKDGAFENPRFDPGLIIEVKP